MTILNKKFYNTDKLLSRCPYFFRLERILGDRPNVRPPILFDSGSSIQDTTSTVEQLLSSLEGHHEHIGDERNHEQGERGGFHEHREEEGGQLELRPADVGEGAGYSGWSGEGGLGSEGDIGEGQELGQEEVIMELEEVEGSCVEERGEGSRNIARRRRRRSESSGGVARGEIRIRSREVSNLVVWEKALQNKYSKIK